jgi:hypothetical protein
VGTSSSSPSSHVGSSAMVSGTSCLRVPPMLSEEQSRQTSVAGRLTAVSTHKMNAHAKKWEILEVLQATAFWMFHSLSVA